MSAPAEGFPVAEPIDLGAVFAKLLAKCWWIIGTVILFSVAFGVWAYTMKPVYRAIVVLTSTNAERGADLLGFSSTSLGGLASGLGIGPKDAETEEALAVLRSRQFTENFIISRNLMPKLFSKQWDVATGNWRADVQRPPTPAKAYKYFDTTIRAIMQDRKTGLITIQIDWTDRNEAAVWANEMVSQLNDEMRARAIDKAEASKLFLDKEAQTTSTVEARDAISRLMETQVKQRMLANVTRDYSFRVVDRAMPADSDDPIKPHKKLMVLLGALLGGVLSGTLVLMADSWARRRP